MQCQECGKEGAGDVCTFCGGTIEESPRWYAEGIAHLTEQKQYAIAFDLLEEGIERYPQSAMLWYNGGVLEELLGNRDGAIRRYQQVLQLRPNNEKARKALERLLGRPLFTPPPPTSYAAQGTPAAAPTVTIPEPVASPAPIEPPAPLPVEAVSVAPPVTEADTLPVESAEAPPARDDALIAPPVGPNGAEDGTLQPVEGLAIPTLAPVGPPWALIALVSGIVSILSFIGLMVFMSLKNSPLFMTDLALFFVSLTLRFIATALSPNIGKRKR